MSPDDGLTGGGEGQTPLHPNDLPGLKHRWVRAKDQLDELERLNVTAGRRWAHSRAWNMETVLDDAFLCKLHRRMFGDVWTWAGTYRKTDVSIGVAWLEVPVATRNTLMDVRAQLDAAVADAERREVVAWAHHRLTVVHPFPNGNGRVSRLYVELIARAAEVPVPTWGVGSPQSRRSYLAALRRADCGDLAPLARFMWISE